ncbi:MAG TPA: dihydropteroate synthase [Nitrospiraceae bacterium]|nr:dihydropteroate synthase [Nitrospiraceae bacterium]
MEAGRHRLDCTERALLMGVLNVTPDSFFDGGLYQTEAGAVARAKQMVEEGVDVIDIGAESSRPGSEPISESEELKRLIPIVEALHQVVSVPLSVDTTKSGVARRAIEAGASIVNDISAMTFDPDMARVVAESGAGIVLMHMQGVPRTMQRAPRYDDVVGEVRSFLGGRIETAVGAGISRKQIMLDPGIGFGKLLEHNLTLLAHLETFTQLGRPLLVGLSRKGFLGQLLHQPVGERLFGTAAAAALAVQQGATILRVHDVGPMRDVIRTVTAIMRCGEHIQRGAHA